MWKYSIYAVLQNGIEIIGIEKKNVRDGIEKKLMDVNDSPI